MSLTIGSLFSGIGGLELGLERGIGNGAHTVWQVEQNEYCRAVLAKHWPDATRYEDVRHVGRANLQRVNVICGGFPCQDVSWANADGLGLDGERSGLWREYRRIVGELRPDYVAVENVAALLHRGLSVVLRDLARIGYDAEWSVVSACSVGATHMRRRLLLVAYPHGEHGRTRLRHPDQEKHGTLQAVHRFARARAGWKARLANPSALYGGADGIPDGMDRNHAIGNAVVPAVAEVVGRLIAEREAARQHRLLRPDSLAGRPPMETR